MIGHVESSELIQSISVIGLSLLAVLAYLVVWLRWINRINVRVNRTIKMLNMIPPQVIQDNSAIYKFIKDFSKKMQRY